MTTLPTTASQPTTALPTDDSAGHRPPADTPGAERNPLIRLSGWLHRHGIDRGQATTEYALVLLGAALVALLLVAWATGGGGAGKIGRLLDHILDTIIGKAS